MSSLCLFVEFFQNENLYRRSEVKYCIDCNINCNIFDRVYIIGKNFENTFLTPINSTKTSVHLISLSSRCTFKKMYQIINEVCKPDDIAVISNNDIYFDNTIELCRTFNLTNYFLALLRRDVNKDNTSQLFEYDINDCFGRKGHRGDSQDVWIAKTPIRIPNNSDFFFGIPGCDNRIAYLMEEQNYKVVNPCYDINIYHLHLSNKRNYIQGKDIVNGPYKLNIPPCFLSQLK